MPRRLISPVRDFPASVAALGSPAASRLVHILLHRIAADPECAPRAAGMNVWVLHTVGFDSYPPLLLFYTFDERAVYPLYVQVSDPALP